MHPAAQALIQELLHQIERVYWNKFELVAGDTLPPLGLRYNSEDEESVLEFQGQRVTWYKHSRRCLECSREYTPAQWFDWYDQALEVVCAYDR